MTLHSKFMGFLASRLIHYTDCRVSRNQFERALGKCFAGWNFVPGRRAGRMRQGNQVEAVVCMHDAKFAANHVLQSSAVDELHDRQSAHRNNETWLQNPNLVIHPQRTVANLIWCWNAVGAAGIFARETAADGGEIDLRSNGGFIHSAKLFEPTEERFAGRVRKRPFQRRFPRTGRLTNDHHIAHDRAA